MTMATLYSFTIIYLVTVQLDIHTLLYSIT